MELCEWCGDVAPFVAVSVAWAVPVCEEHRQTGIAAHYPFAVALVDNVSVSVEEA